MRKRWLPYLFSILLALIVGLAPAVMTRSKAALYADLNLPWLSPPMWVFPVVWTLFYASLGWSMAKVWQREVRERKKAAIFYAVQFAMNVLWVFFFFQWQMYLFSFFWLVALAMTAAHMVEKFRLVSDTAANLQIPYVAWLVYAVYLNFGVYLLNGAPVKI